MTVIASGPNPNLLDDLISNNVDSIEPQAYVREPSTEQASFDAPFAQEELVELYTAMDIELEDTDNLCRIY